MYLAVISIYQVYRIGRFAEFLIVKVGPDGIIQLFKDLKDQQLGLLLLTVISGIPEVIQCLMFVVV